MKTRFIGTALLFCLCAVVLFAPTTVFAGTASASDTAQEGENCGQISKKSNQTTGILTVETVSVNGTPLKEGKDADYTVEGNGTTKPKIKFNKALAKDDKVDVTLTSGKKGHFDVNLTLSKCNK